MATGNQGQGQGRRGEARGHNGGAGQGQGVRETAQNLGQAAQQGMEQMSNRLREGYDMTRDESMRRYRRAEGMIARNPAPSVLIGFGLGFGLGLALCSMLTTREESWAERHLPDSLQDFPDRLRKARVPGSVRQTSGSLQGAFHSLAESIRDLPAAIARHFPGH
jgi:hypothetical protein